MLGLIIRVDFIRQAFEGEFDGGFGDIRSTDP